MKIIILFFLFFSSFFTGSAQLLSPEQFLGYRIGTRYTPCYKIDDYFKAVAAAKPSMVKLESYGKTNEGRELMLAYIALPENLQRLEDIRKNNLRLSGSLQDGVAAQTEGVPAIVWLSYNVHGNETSSSEAAMLTLFVLADDNNAQTKQWLKNTVIIIDPHVNPDGRDRYINWFTSVVGNTYNADPQAREHREPWPGGRTNHYNFDLNRDWAWQTQIETQQRMKKYNDWLPQIHVDYHEQGPNSPYYFAPAAQPYHEALTQWQRDFQVTIGKNNAKYFDANGWLYFTKQVFDLFYPSYGDTYPLYNGAIGMTYEQGGGPAGGLGILKNDGDTLTLLDRITHHVTTGMSTIEVASANANKLITEYKKFFNDAANGVNTTYKTYVLTAKDKTQLDAIATLLTKNHIEYGTTSVKSFRGYNYQTGKDEDYADEGYQLAVSAYQPRGTLVRVLFEPKSVLNDSATYDITAWSLPYVFNVKGYGVKDKLSILPGSVTSTTPVQSNYGLIIPYTSYSGGKVLAYLLSHDVKVRFSDKAFTYKNKNYAPGTLIVLRGSNIPNWNAVVNRACDSFHVQAYDAETGFVEKGSDFGSSDVHFIHAPKVALVTGAQTSSLGAGEVWHFFEQSLHYPLTLINADDLNRADISKYNVLIFPDGNYNVFSDATLTDKLKLFVRNGNKIIAMQDAVAAMAGADWYIKVKEEKPDSAADNNYSYLKKYGNQEQDELTSSVPGTIYKLEMDNTHPLAYGYPDYYYTLKQDKNVYSFLKDGWNVGVFKKNGYVAGFAGSKAKLAIKDGVVFGVQEVGEGSLVFMADDVLFREFWEGGKLMFVNAVFMVGQ